MVDWSDRPVLAALLYGKEDLRLEQVADPTPAAGEVVIRVKAATTCGTDLKVWRRGGHAKMLKPPTPFGHEAAGEIVALGAGVEGWKIGDREAFQIGTRVVADRVLELLFQVRQISQAHNG